MFFKYVQYKFSIYNNSNIVIVLRCVIVEGLICSIRTGTPVDAVHVYDFLRSKFTS